MVINSKLAKYSYVVSIKFSSLRKYATLKFYSVITTFYALIVFSARIVSLAISWIFSKLAWLLDKLDVRL
jgi:hypothetical protein